MVQAAERASLAWTAEGGCPHTNGLNNEAMGLAGGSLVFETKARLGQRVESTPYQAIDRHHGRRHHHGRGQQ
jgi:hypothetical protein